MDSTEDTNTDTNGSNSSLVNTTISMHILYITGAIIIMLLILWVIYVLCSTDTPLEILNAMTDAHTHITAIRDRNNI